MKVFDYIEYYYYSWIENEVNILIDKLMQNALKATRFQNSKEMNTKEINERPTPSPHLTSWINWWYIVCVGTLFASSSFYSTSMHPTVEDQIAMARTISNSLSDVSNKRSRGQLMYVNRRIRSAMWVHESPNGPNDESTAETNENGNY